MNRNNALLPKVRVFVMRILLLVVLMLVAPTAAQAHDQLVDAAPKEGETVEAGIIDVNLRFSDDVLALGSGNEILVIGPAGEESVLQNNSCAFVDGDQVSTQVDLDQPGDYTVSWRVVSGDGHPISGIQRFSVVNTTGHVSDGIVSGTECDTAIETLDESGTESAIDAQWLWLLGLFPIIGLIIYFALRPKQKIDQSKDE